MKKMRNSDSALSIETKGLFNTALSMLNTVDNIDITMNIIAGFLSLMKTVVHPQLKSGNHLYD
jgi:hypothetical protein